MTLGHHGQAIRTGGGQSVGPGVGMGLVGGLVGGIVAAKVEGEGALDGRIGHTEHGLLKAHGDFDPLIPFAPGAFEV